MSVYRNLRLLALLCVLVGCTVEGSAQEYLSEVFPPGYQTEITDSCGGGLSPVVVLFDVSHPLNGEAKLVGFEPELGKWTRASSMRQFAETNSSRDVAGTILDTKDCLKKLLTDANTVLGQSMPGLYFRNDFGSVVIVLPEDQPGTGILFSQGR